MRTTLEIDNDVLETARSLARQSNRSAGAVLSDLARRAVTSTLSKPEAGTGVGGFVPFESRGGACHKRAVRSVTRAKELLKNAGAV